MELLRAGLFGENFRVGVFGSFVVRQFTTTAHDRFGRRQCPYNAIRHRTTFFRGQGRASCAILRGESRPEVHNASKRCEQSISTGVRIEFCHLRVGRDTAIAEHIPVLVRSVVDAAVMKLSDLAWIWQSSKTTIDGPKMKSVVPSM